MVDAESNPNDLVAYMEEQCHISSSQKEILRHSPFVGETVNLPHHESSPSSGGIPVASTGIVITSLTAETTQDAGKDSGPQDVFHTPPEQSSLPTSQQSEYAEALELVNLSDDSELGLGQVKIKQRIEPESKDGLDESPHEENEIAETSEKRPELRVLPSSIREGIEKTAKDKKEERKGNSGFDFIVLKALIQNNSEGDSDDDGVSWLELAKARGIDFPRPRWKKEKDDEKN